VNWPMPWRHVYLEGGFTHEMAKAFGVTSIPKPLLIDPEGNVIAVGRQLRGPNLRKTLANVLGDAG